VGSLLDHSGVFVGEVVDLAMIPYGVRYEVRDDAGRLACRMHGPFNRPQPWFWIVDADDRELAAIGTQSAPYRFWRSRTWVVRYPVYVDGRFVGALSAGFGSVVLADSRTTAIDIEDSFFAPRLHLRRIVAEPPDVLVLVAIAGAMLRRRSMRTSAE
jgi:hypothetical protein